MSNLLRGAAPTAAVVLSLVAALVAPAGAGAEETGEAGAGPSQVHLLYVLQAREGWTLRRPDGHWRLELAGVSPRMLAFSDRPQRISSQIPTRAFVASWQQLFAADPPNAAMVVAHGPREAPPIAAELFKARWNGGRLELCMCEIGDESAGWLHGMTRRGARRHGAITLFIDDAATGTTYATPGSYSYTVPAGVSEVLLEGWGAGAAGYTMSPASYSAPPSAGGTTSGVFAVTPGETLEVAVGAAGTSGAPGVPDGGQGTARVCQAGGGGGSTRIDVRRPGAGTSTPLLVAGGGGGYSLIATTYVPGSTFVEGGAPGSPVCSVAWAAPGGDGRGQQIGGSPPEGGMRGVSTSTPGEARIQATEWALGGGGGGGGGRQGEGETLFETFGPSAGGAGGGAPGDASYLSAYLGQFDRGGGGGTNWLASGVTLPQSGTASAGGQNGSAVILPLG